MKKSVLFAIAVASLLLAACGSAQATPQKTTPTRTPTTAPTAAQVKATVAPISGGCAPVTLLPSPDPAIPGISQNDYIRGPQDASITFIIYGDFQCEACAQLDGYFKQLLAANPDVSMVYRYFPEKGHALSLIAAQAAEAAAYQGRFWSMHDALLANLATWTSMTQDAFITWVKGEASALGLDPAKFETDMTGPLAVKMVDEAQSSAIAIGIPSTPYVLINGIYIGSQVDDATLNNVLSLTRSMQALEPKTFKSCPPTVVDNTRQYFAHVSTSKGDFVIQLYPDKAPIAVNSFVFLAQNGWYDGNPFHRVIPGFVAQTGDPSGTGRGNPGYAYVIETSDLKFDKPGVVGIANMGQNTGGSQFFIAYSAQSSLDGQYTIIGQVTEGMDVVQKLTPRDPSVAGTLPDPDTITRVTIEVK